MENKLTYSIPFLTEGLPREFEEMLSYVRCIYFSDEPNYDYLAEKFYQIAKREKFDLSEKDYDWLKREKQVRIERVNK